MEVILIILVVVGFGVLAALLISLLKRPVGQNSTAEGRADALQQQITGLQQEKAVLQKENQQLATERAQLLERERAAQEAKSEAIALAQEAEKMAF